MNIDRVLLAGRITRPMTLRQTHKGTDVTTLSIAVNRRHRKANGEPAEEVVFFDVTVYGPNAVHAAKRLTTGSEVVIEGHHKQFEWEDTTTGKKVFSLQIVGEHVHYCKPAKEVEL